MFEIQGRFNTAKVFATEIDQETISQIMQLCNQPWARDSHIAIMPDCHAGKGCTVGTTMSVRGKACPNLVGVDIGCGMLTVELPPELSNPSLPDLDAFIHREIPSGFSVNAHRMFNPRFERLEIESLRCFPALEDVDRLEKSVGSLGGGNHFIELDRDEDGCLYLVIHTGSRGLGKQVAEHYQRLAERDCEDRGEHVPRFLSWLEGAHLEDYLHDMYLCQRYAQVNRAVIASRILKHLFDARAADDGGEGAASPWRGEGATRSDCTFGGGAEEGGGPAKGASPLRGESPAEARGDTRAKSGSVNIDASRGRATYQSGRGGYLSFSCFETVHNYISPDDLVLRKGAISAHEGERVLIPINMRDGAIVGYGLGNPDYNQSGPHGAGRLLSRGEAKRFLSLDEFERSMGSVFTTSVGASTLDEAPMAYKPIDSVLENIADSIRIDRRIMPIYNFKAH